MNFSPEKLSRAELAFFAIAGFIIREGNKNCESIRLLFFNTAFLKKIRYNGNERIKKDVFLNNVRERELL